MTTRDLEQCVARAWPSHEWRDVHVVLAVSGGADSVAMLWAVTVIKQQIGGRGQLSVAHFHHGLRGAAADEDQRFVEQLAARLGVGCHCGRADPARLNAGGDGLEAGAREVRYQFLTRTAEQLGARFVATAHTADDQVETVLHHILRGSGLAGLAGMPSQRPLSNSVSLVRPLLATFRTEVLEYLSELGQDYRTDATNDDRQFTRNRLRQELLPNIRQFRPEVDAALLRLSAQAAEAQAWISDEARHMAEPCVRTESPNEYVVDVRSLGLSPPLLVREVFKVVWEKAGWPRQEMGFAEWQLLADLAAGEMANSSVNLPGGVQAVRERESVRLSRGSSIS